MRRSLLVLAASASVGLMAVSARADDDVPAAEVRGTVELAVPGMT